jgi:tungstate transport system ATP-binding protein
MDRYTVYDIKNLKRRYGQGFLLDIPSLSIERNRSYGFVGPNGSGKSTLLRILAFIDEPDEGTIRFFEKNSENDMRPADSMSNAKQNRIPVTMLLQEPYLFKRSVFENVAYGLRVQGIRRGLRERVHESLHLVGLDPHNFAHRKWSELSGGEAQRVALAARLALKPDVLILDEPTASVDRVSAHLIKETIKVVRREYLSTLLIASHDLIWLHEVSDEILKMHEGFIIGSEQDNFIPGHWSPDPDGLWSTGLADGQRIRVLKPPAEDSIALLDTTDTIVTTRQPDHLSAQNILAGRLLHMYTFENTERVKLDIQVANLSLTSTVTRAAVSSLGLMPGLNVWVVFKASSVQWQ